MALQPYTITTYKKPATTIQDLIAQTQAAETEARQKQLEQAELARTYLQQIVDIYGPEGAYGRGMELMLESQKRQDIGRAAQTGISRGLYGIRDYGAEWEATVGTKARATLEDIRLGRRAQALAGLAGFEAGIEYEQPDYATLMQAVAAGQQIPSGTVVTPTYGTTTEVTGARGRPGWTPPQVSGMTQWTAEPATGARGTAPTPGEIYESGAAARAIEMGPGYGPAYGTAKPGEEQVSPRYQKAPGYMSRPVSEQIAYLRAKKKLRGLSSSEERYLQSLY